jgi:acetyl-CoA carboxylase biotin carboxyl carrier protein
MSTRRSESDGTNGEAESPLVEYIKSLAEAMAGTNVTDLELLENGMEIRLHRDPVTSPGVSVGNIPTSNLPMPVPTTDFEPPTAPAETSSAILAPLTGVFYASSSPSSPPFVQIGDTVQPNQVVCIVEAMKVFNEIKSDIGGTVVAIPPTSGQLVKKGDPLVRIKPF